MRLNRNHDGFSLVELAISVTVIGVLLVAIVKGKAVIDNSRVSATIAKVKDFKTAVTSFQGIYNAYPGDLPAAGLAQLNCPAAAGCAAGDGDRRIELPAGVQPAATIRAGAGETVQFWKHLAVAELISGVSIAAPVAVANFAAGQSHPQGKYAGSSFDVYFDMRHFPDGRDANQIGHYIRLSTGALTGALGNVHPLTPAQAFSLDTKIDDGQIYTGQVTGAGSAGGGQSCSNGNDLTAGYLRANTAESCTMFFKFGGRRG